MCHDVHRSAGNLLLAIYVVWCYHSDSYQWRIQNFPEEGAPTPGGGRQHTILAYFPKNYMKLKEFGPGGGGMSLVPPLDLPLVMLICWAFCEIHGMVEGTFCSSSTIQLFIHHPLSFPMLLPFPYFLFFVLTQRLTEFCAGQ